MRVTWEPGTRPDELRDLDDWDVGILDIQQEQHGEVDHGVFALEALVYCYEARIPAPQWVTDWLGQRLVSWLDGETTSLDQALEVASAGPGRRRPRDILSLQRERSDDAWLIFVLNEEFSISVDDAAEMVCDRKCAAGRSGPDPSWLAEAYRKQWIKMVSRETRDQAAELFLSDESRRAFLASFPSSDELGRKR